jgi:hypothetical protein
VKHCTCLYTYFININTTIVFVDIAMEIFQNQLSLRQHFAWSYVRASILITCGKHLHDHIISLRWEVWAHKTTLVSPYTFFLNACTKPGKWAVMYLCVRSIVTKPVPSQESERSCICVLGVYIFPLSSLFPIRF